MIASLNIVFQGTINKAYLFHIKSTSSTYGCVTAGHILVNLERNITRWSASQAFVSLSEVEKLVQTAREEATKLAEVIN